MATAPLITRLRFRGANLEFLRAKDPELILAGPSDTGKSWVNCYKSARLCHAVAGTRIALVRRTLASIQPSIVKTMDRVLAGYPITRYGGRKVSAYVFRNGSEIVPVGMDKPDKLLSTEWGGVQVCQAEELKEADWETIKSRATGRGTPVKNPQIYGDCNPGGSKHWLRERARRARVDGAGMTLRMISNRHQDNPDLYDDAGNLTAEGKKRIGALENTLTGVRRKRLLLGIWATAEGAVFDTFDAAVHASAIVDVGTIVRWMLCIDEGYTNPAAILLVGADGDGRWHVFREFYQRGVLPKLVVRIAAAWCKNPLAVASRVFFVEEPDPVKAQLTYLKRFTEEVDKLEKSPTIAGAPVQFVNATEYASAYPVAVDAAAAGLIASLTEAGLPAQGGKGRVQDGIYRLQNRLEVQGDNRPRLTIDPRCVDTINEFESHVWKPDAPKDTPVDADNHSIAALRYLADVLGEPTGAWSADQIAAAMATHKPAEVEVETATDAFNTDLTTN